MPIAPTTISHLPVQPSCPSSTAQNLYEHTQEEEEEEEEEEEQQEKPIIGPDPIGSAAVDGRDPGGEEAATTAYGFETPVSPGGVSSQWYVDQ